jgi:hypothetical protein
VKTGVDEIEPVANFSTTTMPDTVNPIIPGYAPDPSVVKVGDWFYLITWYDRVDCVWHSCSAEVLNEDGTELC